MRLLGVETVHALGPQHVCVSLHTLILYVKLTCPDQHSHGRAADLRRPLWPRFFTTCFPGKALNAYNGIFGKCRYHVRCKDFFSSISSIILRAFLRWFYLQSIILVVLEYNNSFILWAQHGIFISEWSSPLATL